MGRFYQLMTVVLGLIACTPKAPPNFKGSIEANRRAVSLVEWDASEENPENIFKKLREEQKSNPAIGKTVCEGLAKLNGQELSLFEGEINNAINSSLLTDCKASLLKTLEDYWEQQKKTLQGETLNFRFQPQIAKRDLSKGYRAFTGDIQAKELILTFDDGPDIYNTPKILDILKLVNAKVMFFHLGTLVRENPGLVQRAAREGHIMGSHTVGHKCLANNATCTRANKGTPLSFEQAEAEIRGGHQALQDVLGFVDPFFRFPFGEFDLVLANFLASKQVGQIHWNVDPEDWKIQDNAAMLQNLLEQIDKAQRGIVLFHDTRRRTLEILPQFLRAIYDRGYTLVVLQSMDEQARDHSQLVTKGASSP